MISDNDLVNRQTQKVMEKPTILVVLSFQKVKCRGQLLYDIIIIDFESIKETEEEFKIILDVRWK